MGLNFYAGSQASTTSEANFFAVTVSGHHSFKINLTPMQAGDKIRINVYDYDATGAAYVLEDQYEFENVQAFPHYSTHWVCSQQYKVTIQRLAGTDRTYNYTRLEVT